MPSQIEPCPRINIRPCVEVAGLSTDFFTIAVGVSVPRGGGGTKKCSKTCFVGGLLTAEVSTCVHPQQSSKDDGGSIVQ